MALEWKDKPVKYLRDTVVDQLQWNLANNHLEIDEFEQRVHIALSTQRTSELVSLTADLPVKDDTGITNQTPKLAAYNDTKSIVSILSETKQTGLWAPPKHLRVVTVLGQTDVDFREVQFEHDVTYLSLKCWLGELNIIVPPGVNVVLQAKNILGSVQNDSHGTMYSDSPTLVIEGKVVLGEATITVQESSTL